jgi:hypothetical protein
VPANGTAARTAVEFASKAREAKPPCPRWYADMAVAKSISPRTQHHVHVALNSCLATATRKGLLAVNPMVRVEQIPTPEQFDLGENCDFTKPRKPRSFSRAFAQRDTRLGFGNTRFHDLRGIHSTALLDAGSSAHAHRIGDDPATC